MSVLQEDGHALQYPKSFLVLDNADIDAMLQVIYEERGLTLRDMTFSKARDMIEIMKLKERPGYYRDMLAMPLEGLRRKYLDATDARDIIFYGYLYQEKKCFGLDYNDLIVFVLYLFEQNPDIRLKWQKRSSTSWWTSSRTSTACSTSSWRCWPATTRTCSWWATPTRPSTPGAGLTCATCWTSTSGSPARAPS